MDDILEVLHDLRSILIHKRKSLQGVVGNQATIEAQRAIQTKIYNLTERIDKVNNCITLRTSEVATKVDTHVPLD